MRLLSVLARIRNAWRYLSGSSDCGSLDVIQDLDRVLPAARAFADPTQDDRLTGLHAVLRQGSGQVPGELEPARARFEQRLDRDPDRRQRMDEAEDLLLGLEATDATEHFLMVSGYSRDELPGVVRERSASYRADHRGPSRHPDRQPVGKPVAMRPGVLAVLGLLCLFSLGSYGSDPLAGPIGDLSGSGSILFGSLGETVRGHGDDTIEEQQVAMMTALDQLDQARTTILGFYTGYERDALLKAMVSLDRAIQAAPLSETVAPELIHLRHEVAALVNRDTGHQERSSTFP